MATLFERLGGFVGVSKIVTDFYDRVLEDDAIGPFFDNVDMRRLIDHQTKFIATVMGGPVSYSNEALQRVHAHVPIDRAAFDRMRDVMDECLRARGVAETDRAHVIDEIEARAAHVVNK
jgi:hemoglobin